MRVKILRRIDENLLKKAIDEAIEKQQPHDYLIMSSETAKDLAHCNGTSIHFSSNSPMYIFQGHFVCFCDALPYGEVEIR